MGHPLGGAAVLVRSAVAVAARGALLQGVQELGGIGGVAAEVVHEVEGGGVVLYAEKMSRVRVVLVGKTVTWEYDLFGRG